MKKMPQMTWHLGVLATLFCCVSLIVAPPVFAAADSMSKIAIVNMDVILQKSTAAKHVREQMNKKMKAQKEKHKKTTHSLDAAKKSLVSEKEKLSEDDFRKKRAEFEQKVIAAQRDAFSGQQKIERSVEQSLKQLRMKSGAIVRDIAKEHNIGIVLSHEQVVMAIGSLDITEDVLARLNKEMKTLPVKW